MKSKRVLLFCITLVTLMATCLIGCSPSADEITEAYQTGYNAGFTEGYNACLAQSEAASESSSKTETPQADLPAGTISWDTAKDHIGDRATVRGPVVGAKYGVTSNGQPTWLNIGKDYPSSERFVVIIWGENRGNFPQPSESYYLGKTICVTGLIQEYEGIPQIEVTTPDQIQEQ